MIDTMVPQIEAMQQQQFQQVAAQRSSPPSSRNS